MAQMQTRDFKRILIQGHRGAMGYAPENTMVSFAKGLELGADSIELDIHLSRDEELIVMHDDDVTRTTDGKGQIKNMTLAEIKKLDAGVKFDARFRGERVPTLAEVVDWAKTRIPLAIEIKGGPLPAPGIEEKLVEPLRAQGVVETSAVISFYHRSVKRVKELEPRLKTGILLTGMLIDPVGAARAARADSLRPAWSYWTAELVAEAHAAGLSTHAWSINDESLLDYLAPMGLDSIGTNYPDRMRAYLNRTGQAR